MDAESESMNTTNSFRVGLVQMRSGREIAPNLEQAEGLIRQAVRNGAEFVLTPENTALMELETQRLFERVRDEADDESLPFFRALAKELGIWLNIGSLAIRLSATKVANRSYVIAPDGAIAARYDKIHMFDVDLPNGESYRESKNNEPGTAAVICDLPWGPVGLTICYDLRFPALYRALAQAGAYFLTVPAAFTRQTGEAHWHVLLRARAIENGAFVFAAAQGGRHENDRATFGHSLIVSPWGEVLNEAWVHPAVIVADIDPAKVEEARRMLPSLQHDRPFSAPEPRRPAQIKAAS